VKPSRARSKSGEATDFTAGPTPAGKSRRIISSQPLIPYFPEKNDPYRNIVDS
jgi:hypothetical protein